MGFLDAFSSNDPQSAAMRQGLLRMGLALMQAKGNPGQILGQAGTEGVNGIQSFQDRQFKQKLQQEALAEIARKKVIQGREDTSYEDAKRLSALPLQFQQNAQQAGNAATIAQTGNLAPTNENAAIQSANANPAFDMQGYMKALYSSGIPGSVQQAALLDAQHRRSAPTIHPMGVNGSVFIGADGRPQVIQPVGGQKRNPSAELQLLEERFGKGTPEYNKALDALIAKHSYIANATEKAPTLGEVMDPADTSRMLKIDARTYRGGSLGSPGVIGIAGKEPGAAARNQREEVKATAKSDAIKAADDIIASLNGYYNTLEKEGGITSTQKGMLPNIGSYIGSSGIGQVVGSAVGTRAQSARDSISQTRPLLLSTLKDALGLTAQQLNSNAELVLWLSAATDPKLSIEANRDALNNIAKRIGVKTAGSGDVPTGVDPQDWKHMTPDERKLWKR